MDFDLIVLGGGPGGYVAAIRAAQLGAKVAVVEKDTVGGTCLNRGCIPTKALVASAEALATIKDAAKYGINVDSFSIDFNQIMSRKKAIVEQLVKGILYLFKKNKIELIKGVGKIEKPGQVRVNNADGTSQFITAKHIIVATGSEPLIPAAWGYNGKTIITSNEALELDAIPESMVILGAGVIACEFASIFAELGTNVTILARSTVLRTVDQELVKRLTTILKKKGINIKTKAAIKSVVDTPQGVKVALESGEEFTAEKVLISIGRTLNSKDIGLEEVGVELGPNGEVLVNDYLETNVEGIYAIGDVTGKFQLAHVASAQGIVAVENIFGDTKRPMDYKAVPNCIFTSPELATVGISSEEAEAQGLKVKVGKFPYQASGKALCIGKTDGLVKFIADAETDRILGAHILGPHANDLIAEATLAIQMGITAEELARTIHAHPTLAESLMEAAEGVHGKSIHV